MKTGVIVLIVGVAMFVPLGMILPFPYGLGSGLAIIIIGIVATFNSKKDKKIEEHSKTNQPNGKFCSKCGTKLSEDSKFCSKCGKTQELSKKDDES